MLLPALMVLTALAGVFAEGYTLLIVLSEDNDPGRAWLWQWSILFLVPLALVAEWHFLPH